MRRGIDVVVAVGLITACAPTTTPRECEPVVPPLFEPASIDEPTWEVDPRWVEGRPSGGAFWVSLWFPAEVGTRSTYAVPGGSDVPFRIRFAVGEEDTTTAVTTIVLVDGRLVEVLLEGAMVSHIEVPLPLGHAITQPVVIPAEALLPGLNRVDVLHFIHRNGGFRAVLGPTFTVAHGSSESRPPLDTVGFEVGTYEPGWPTRAYRTIAAVPELGETPFPQWTPAFGVLDDPTHVSLRVQPFSLRSSCEPHDAHPDELMLVAFRDMQPVALGDAEQIVATIGWGEQRIFRFDLALEFPEDEFHHHVIIELTGLSRATRRESGGLTPWTRSQIVSEVFWGWRPTEE